MARPFVLLSSLVFLILACREAITAPGACPEYCAPGVITLLDTVLLGSVERDSSFQGYVEAFEAGGIQVSGAGAPVQSRGLVRFLPLPENAAVGNLPIVQIDSFRVTVSLKGRTVEASGIEIVIHRVPVTLDSLATFAELDPYFEDSTVVGSIAIPDDVEADTLSGLLPGDAFPTLAEDGQQVAIGLTVRAAAPAFASIAASEIAEGALLTRFVQADSADGELAARNDLVGPQLDFFLRPPIPPLDDVTLAVGGLPSIRSLLRFELPPAIIDSSVVVGATLFLLPVEPAIGAPGATINVLANALGADFGPKSPIVAITDSAALVGTLVDVGASDTVEVDLSVIFAQWQDNRSLPHSIMLRVGREGSTIGELRFGSSSHATARPFLHITYVPPLDLNT